MNDIQGYQNGPVESGASRAKEMSPRAYNLVMSALIFLLGELVEHAPTAQLFKNPTDPRTADYLTGRFG